MALFWGIRGQTKQLPHGLDTRVIGPSLALTVHSSAELWCWERSHGRYPVNLKSSTLSGCQVGRYQVISLLEADTNLP